MRGRADLPELRQRLLAIIVDEPGVPPYQSKFYEKIFDPALVLDFNKDPYPLERTPVITDIRTNVDALQVMIVNANISSVGLCVGRWSEPEDPTDTYVRVVYTPMLVGGAGLLPEGGKLVIWNARGFARHSLEANLVNIRSKYNPFVVIITESRVSKPNFSRIFKELELEMEWEVDQSLSISGGIVVLWDKSASSVDLMRSLPGVETLRFLGDI